MLVNLVYVAIALLGRVSSSQALMVEETWCLDHHARVWVKITKG